MQIAQMDKKSSLTLGGPVRTKMARLVRNLKGPAQDHEESRTALIKELGEFSEDERGYILKTKAANDKFMADFKTMRESDVEVKTEVLKLDEFQTSKNEVPFDLLADLHEAGLLDKLE